MKIKLKSKLWVWLHCKRIKQSHFKYKVYGNNQVYLYPSVFRRAGKVVEAVLVDKDALGVLSDAAYMIKVNGHQVWVPNWFISEVFN